MKPSDVILSPGIYALLKNSGVPCLALATDCGELSVFFFGNDIAYSPQSLDDEFTVLGGPKTVTELWYKH
jgi:hypothetical protein